MEKIVKKRLIPKNVASTQIQKAATELTWIIQILQRYVLRYESFFNKFLLIDATSSKIMLTCSDLTFKETESVILSDPPCKDGNARFTLVSLKRLSGQ